MCAVCRISQGVCGRISFDSQINEIIRHLADILFVAEFAQAVAQLQLVLGNEQVIVGGRTKVDSHSGVSVSSCLHSCGGLEIDVFLSAPDERG